MGCPEALRGNCRPTKRGWGGHINPGWSGGGREPPPENKFDDTSSAGDVIPNGSVQILAKPMGTRKNPMKS